MPRKKQCPVSPTFSKLDDVGNGETPIWTYSIVRLDKGIVDCHNLHITVLDAVNRFLA